MIINDFFFINYINIKFKNIKELINIYNFNKKKKISKQKTRGEVNYSNIKLWKQKGTGKARIGTKGSPILKGGGRSFPSIPSKSKKKILKKKYKKIFNNIYNKGFYDKKIFFINIPFLKIKTFIFIEFLNNILNIKNKKILFVIKEEKYFLMIRNILNIEIILFKYLSVYNIINNDIILIDLKIKNDIKNFKSIETK